MLELVLVRVCLFRASVSEFLREAFAAPEVQTVIAHTLAEPGPSVRVLEKAAFVHEGEVPDDEVGASGSTGGRT